MKKILLVIVISLFSISFEVKAWDGYASEGEFLIPTTLIEFCGLSEDSAEDEDALSDCLDKVIEQRDEKRKIAIDLSSKVMQDYMVKSLASSAAVKSFAGDFMPDADVKEAEGATGTTDDDTSEVNEAINRVTFMTKDNAVLMNKFLQQYASVVAINAYRTFHSENVVKKSAAEIDKDVNPFSIEDVPVMEFEETTILDREPDLSVPSQYAKLAPNCGDYESVAKETKRDVVTVLDDCLVERRDDLGESVIKAYEKSKADIDELRASYETEFNDNIAKVNAETNIVKKDELRTKTYETAKERKSTLRSKTNELNRWYKKEMMKLESIILGGG
ncbi:MAG: hypothetical protein R3Y43_06210 [Alphaproteobacteria bacterium]